MFVFWDFEAVEEGKKVKKHTEFIFNMVHLWFTIIYMKEI